jgi:ATP-dependent DNA helicase RecQ
MSAPEPLLAAARHALAETYGFAGYRPGQEEIVAALLGGEDVLAVMPTGAGKSLCFQLPALVRGGLTLVVSPLIALMRDQLRALEALGLPAAALHSGEDDFEIANAYEGVASGRVKLLYVAPEGLAREGTLDLLRKTRVALLAVDEAHCISYWGHDFRPEYARLGELARSLGSPPILAVTASAGPHTRDDIAALLFPHPPQVFLRSFARENLALAFRERRDGLRQLADFVERHAGSSGIVYCNSRRKVDVLARDLRGFGFDALPYHAGQGGEERSAHQDAFFAREGVVMVATIAFGMGVDKPNVRFVAHADPPDSVEGYYQEIGRAGRDGLPANTLLLFDRRELARRWRPPAALANDPVALAESLRRRAMARLCVAPRCRVQALLAEFGEESAPCGACDHCRGIFAATRRAKALVTGLQAAALSWTAGLRDDAGALEDLKPEEATSSAPDEWAPPSPGTRAPALSVARERLLRELFAARLTRARARGLALRRIVSDDALMRLARGDSVGAALEGVDPRDAGVFLAVLARSRQA